jgi:hypothetical protein
MATAQKRTRVDERGGTFRILIGEHLDQGPPGCECDDCLSSKGKNHRYRARRTEAVKTRQGFFAKDGDDYDGDLVESDQDLEARFNAGPFSRKFERVNSIAPRPAATPPAGQQQNSPPPPSNLQPSQTPGGGGDESRRGGGHNHGNQQGKGRN